MDYTAYSQRGTDSMSSGSFVDWVGVLGSPAVSDQALKGPQDTPTTISRFGRDVDDALGNASGAMAPWDFVCEPDPVVDWQDIFNAATPYPPPMLADDTSSTAYSPTQPRSPLSDCTLVDSPFPSLPNLESSPAGDALVNQPVASSPISSFDGFKFAFQCQPMATITPSDLPPPSEQHYHFGSYDYCEGQYWPGQQLPQHEIGAAGVVAPSLTSVVGVNANTFAFTAIDSASIGRLPPSADLQQEHAVIKDPKPIQTGSRNKRSRAGCDVDSKSSPACESNAQETPRPKRKRKQDTTKRYECDFPGCASKHSRSHNLKVHRDSVHFGKRPHVCGEPGCPRKFSRKHDLIRHFQSAHTDLGSPRKASNAKGNKGATDRKVIKANEYEA